MKTAATLTINPAIDINSTVENVAAERKLRCGPLHYEPGGGGINVSRALHNLGGSSKAIYTRGGPTGEILDGLLTRYKVDCFPLNVEGWTRVNYNTLEESTGQQYRFVGPGPTIQESEAQRILEELSSLLNGGHDILVISGSLPPSLPEDFYARVVRIGNQAGMRVILDTSGPPLRAGLEEGVYLAKPNLRELSLLVGDPLETESSQEDAAKEIAASEKTQVVVVSLGAAGVMMAAGGRVIRIRTPTVKIRSKVGAGDSMVAGIVFGLAQGRPLEDAVRLGLAAGAAAVMTPGTQLCRGEDTWKLYGQISR